MPRRLSLRLQDILTAIKNLNQLMTGRTIVDLDDDPAVRAAFERFMEIISEASRHVPDGLKDAHVIIPWKDIANIGNVLRHAYHTVDAQVLWQTYVNDLEPLERAIREMTTSDDR